MRSVTSSSRVSSAAGGREGIINKRGDVILRDYPGALAAPKLCGKAGEPGIIDQFASIMSRRCVRSFS